MEKQEPKTFDLSNVEFAKGGISEIPWFKIDIEYERGKVLRVTNASAIGVMTYCHHGDSVVEEAFPSTDEGILKKWSCRHCGSHMLSYTERCLLGVHASFKFADELQAERR